MKHLLLILIVLLFSSLGLTGTASAQQGTVGAGRTVTETVSNGSGMGSATVHYEGLGTSTNANTGTRYVKKSDGKWYADGTWSKSGDDVNVYAGEWLAQTNKGMGKTTNKSGPMTNLPAGWSGSWAD